MFELLCSEKPSHTSSASFFLLLQLTTFSLNPSALLLSCLLFFFSATNMQNIRWWVCPSSFSVTFSGHYSRPITFMSLCNCAHSVECLHWHNIPASPWIDAGFPLDIIFYHQHSWFSLLISLSILALSKVMWCSKQTMLRLPRKIKYVGHPQIFTETLSRA